MTQTIDARGLSCPQPVLMTLDAIKSSPENQLRVLVDNEASKENVTRAVQSKGWEVLDMKDTAGETELTIQKG